MAQNSQRDAKGRLLPGHGIRSPGRPKTVGTDYAKLIREALTPTAAFEIIERAISDAKEGDHRARSWLFSHVVAPVPKTVVVSDEQIASREVIDDAIARLSPAEVAALERVVSGVEARL
jgi:hypothetical protein